MLLMIITLQNLISLIKSDDAFNYQNYVGVNKGPPRPEMVSCHKGSAKCPHVVIVDKYHYNKKVWEAYHSWLDTQKVAGECPECGISVKKVSGKTEGASIQQHKIEECRVYPYGNKKKLKQIKQKK